MVLQFLCPNGHKVHCSEDRAGQAAKCPRCGIKFRIPSMEELDQGEQAPEVSPGSSVKAGSGSVTETAASGVGLGAAESPDEIEFLCPNDHLLHGPARLQGRPGRCPECGSRFRIPTYDDLPSDLDESLDESPGHGPEASSIELAGAEESSATGAKSVCDASGSAKFDAVGNSSQTGLKHPAAELVGRFWRLKVQGAGLEIRYGEGHRLTPDEFLRSLSTAAHGVFAVREPNGTLTLTAITWDSIHTLIARGVRHLGD